MGELIVVEAFSEDTIADQAADIQQLVAGNKDWLEQARPDVARNYETYPKAVASMRRVLDAETIDGYLFRVDRVAVALGTVTTKLCVWRPGSRFRTVEGDQIDYWGSEELGVLEHVEVAQGLLAKTTTPNKLALLTEAERRRADGIPLTMRRFGTPGKVRVPPHKRDYGLRGITEEVQMYWLGPPPS